MDKKREFLKPNECCSFEHTSVSLTKEKNTERRSDLLHQLQAPLTEKKKLNDLKKLTQGHPTQRKSANQILHLCHPTFCVSIIKNP